MNPRNLIPFALLLPSVAAAANPIQHGFFVSHFDHVLGTSLTVKLSANSLAVARQAEQTVLNEMARLEAELSSFRPESAFRQWLAAPMGEAVAVSADLFAVLHQFDLWREQTGGVLNAAAEHLSQLWQQAALTEDFDKLSLTPTEIEQAVAAVNQTHWLLDTDAQTATRLIAISLRLHTFAKGYVLNRAADLALNLPGVNGLVLNSGGDILVRGNWQETIAVANPRAHADNAPALTQLNVQNATIATSGNYRRGFQIGSERVSHIMDPRTGMPACDIISATVLHPDAVTAGALATTFNILTPTESAILANQHPGTEYLLVTRNGTMHSSAGWPGVALPLVQNTNNQPTTAHLLSVPPKDKLWNANQELMISLEVARIESGIFERGPHRPFVSVWIEDEAGKPIRQLALWFNKPRWLRDLREWNNLNIGREVAMSVSSATRSPGQYTLVWDGKDNSGQLVKQGKYTVLIEAAREHGTYQLIRQVMDFNGKPKKQTLNGNVEIAAAALDYREKAPTR